MVTAAEHDSPKPAFPAFQGYVESRPSGRGYGG